MFGVSSIKKGWGFVQGFTSIMDLSAIVVFGPCMWGMLWSHRWQMMGEALKSAFNVSQHGTNIIHPIVIIPSESQSTIALAIPICTEFVQFASVMSWQEDVQHHECWYI